MTKVAHLDQNFLRLHGVMKFVIDSIDLDKKLGNPADPAITRQPLFEEFRKILKDIPRLRSKKDFKNFAQRREDLQGLWMSSMQSMDNALALEGNFSVAYLTDQFTNNPKEMLTQLKAHTQGLLSEETVAPVQNMLELLASDAIGHAERTHWQETSGNPFGLARREGAKAEVSARAKKAVKKRIENDPTALAKRMVEDLWREALDKPGSFKGFKAEFARQMHDLVKSEHGGIIVSERTITEWTIVWGGKLQRTKEVPS